MHRLAPEEIFILIAAGYLHDIGMQCTNQTVFRRVKARVSSAIPSEYTVGEQLEIRRKHSELSAEMIQFAFQTSDKAWTRTDHVNSIKRIDSGFIDPIMDVVRFHSRADVLQCPEFCLGNKRRRMLAMLLRLADEMDIAKDRVSIDEVTLYPKPLQSEYWWWVHYHTTLVEVRDNRIIFYLRMNKKDRRHSDILQRSIVDSFVSKNKELIDRLSQYGIPLLCASDVKWEFGSNVASLRKDVLEMIKSEAQEYVRNLVGQYERDFHWINIKHAWLLKHFRNKFVAVLNSKVVGYNASLGDLQRNLKLTCPNHGDAAIAFIQPVRPRFFFQQGGYRE